MGRYLAKIRDGEIEAPTKVYCTWCRRTDIHVDPNATYCHRELTARSCKTTHEQKVRRQKAAAKAKRDNTPAGAQYKTNARGLPPFCRQSGACQNYSECSDKALTGEAIPHDSGAMCFTEISIRYYQRKSIGMCSENQPYQGRI